MNFLNSFSDFIKPICLPGSENLRNINYEGTNLEVAGWGKTENGNSFKSPLNQISYSKLSSYSFVQ